MRFIGNIIWFVFIGFFEAIAWFILGLLWCITIVGIPFGRECFKIASLIIWPFGKDVHTHFDKHPIANIIWLIFGATLI